MDGARTRYNQRRTVPPGVLPTGDGDTVLDREHHVLRGPAGCVALSPSEVIIMRLLLDARGRLVPRTKIIRELYDGRLDGGPDNPAGVLSVLIWRLRCGLADVGSALQINVVWGVGFILEPEPEP